LSGSGRGTAVLLSGTLVIGGIRREVLVPKGKKKTLTDVPLLFVREVKGTNILVPGKKYPKI